MCFANFLLISLIFYLFLWLQPCSTWNIVTWLECYVAFNHTECSTWNILRWWSPPPVIQRAASEAVFHVEQSERENDASGCARAGSVPRGTYRNGRAPLPCDTTGGEWSRVPRGTYHNGGDGTPRSAVDGECVPRGTTKKQPRAYATAFSLCLLGFIVAFSVFESTFWDIFCPWGYSLISQIYIFQSSHRCLRGCIRLSLSSLHQEL